MSLEMYNRLYSEELAIKILVRLPPSDQDRVKHLATLPNLIVESLLMDSRVERVFRIMREFPELQSDSLALTYAAKAVLFDRPRASVGSGGDPADSAEGSDSGAALMSDDEAPVFTTFDCRLTGDPENDNAVREMFRYRQVDSTEMGSSCAHVILVLTGSRFAWLVVRVTGPEHCPCEAHPHPVRQSEPRRRRLLDACRPPLRKGKQHWLLLGRHCRLSRLMRTPGATCVPR